MRGGWEGHLHTKRVKFTQKKRSIFTQMGTTKFTQKGKINCTKKQKLHTRGEKITHRRGWKLYKKKEGNKKGKVNISPKKEEEKTATPKRREKLFQNKR